MILTKNFILIFLLLKMMLKLDLINQKKIFKNKLISEINNSFKDNKVTLDFSINSTTETVKNINDFIDTKFSDETQRVFVRNSIGNSITDLLKITNPDNLKIK